MMMMTMKMMHPEAIPANKATSEPRILFPECPALLPSVLDPARRGDTRGRGSLRGPGRGRRGATPPQTRRRPPARPRPRPSRPPHQDGRPWGALLAPRSHTRHGPSTVPPRRGRAGTHAGRGPLLSRLPPWALAPWESQTSRTRTGKPCRPAPRPEHARDCWGLGRRSTRTAFVLFDLHLKYIWKAAETLTLNRLPTQMLSTKKKKIAWHHYMIHLSVCHKNLTHLVIES